MLNNMLNQDSLFMPIGQGVCAKDLDRGERIAHFWPVEILPTKMSRIEVKPEVRKSKGVTGSKTGAPFAVKIVQSDLISAIWKGDTNRVTQPDLREGEMVTLYRLKGSDQYFWESNGRDDNLRRLETVSYAVSANPDKADVDPSPENCHILTVSGHDNHITLTTSTGMLNGETVWYVWQLHMGEGTHTLEDSVGNHFHINSLEHILELYNVDESLIQIDKEIINIYAKSEINLETTTYNIKCETMNIDAVTINTTATTINYEANNYNITAETYHKGNISVVGNVGISGGLSVGGGGAGFRAAGSVEPSSFNGQTTSSRENVINNGLTINGYLNVNGPVNVSDNIKVPNIDCSTISGTPLSAYLN